MKNGTQKMKQYNCTHSVKRIMLNKYPFVKCDVCGKQFDLRYKK